MSWRNHETHAEETKAVRNALKAVGINAKIGHDSGTAWDWLKVNIGEGQQFGEHVNHVDSAYRSDRCPRCCNMDAMRVTAQQVTREVTGRTGEYGGRIGYMTQDHWNRSAKCSQPIVHPNWKAI